MDEWYRLKEEEEDFSSFSVFSVADCEDENVFVKSSVDWSR